MAVALLITGYYRHPKMLAAGEAAEVMFCRGLDYCAEHGTGGRIPSAAAVQLCPTKTKARTDALVRVGLWHVTDDGWDVHDYSEWNRSQADLAARAKAKHEAKVRAGKKGADARWGGRLANGKADSKPVADMWQSDSPGPGPGSGSGLEGSKPPGFVTREPFGDLEPDQPRPSLRSVCGMHGCDGTSHFEDGREVFHRVSTA
jgi:hypothetical protein